MFDQPPVFFDHSRHTLEISGLGASIDVLTFEGNESLSQPFCYRIEFTSTAQDIGADLMLGRDAAFSLHVATHLLPIAIPGLSKPLIKPLRTLHGVITGFKRLSGSVDQTRYEVTLQPRLALLARGRQFRVYQHQSVPQIVESILRSRHDFEGQDFLFDLVCEYPRREQVMQFGESDLSFISRLLADVGIWYRFTCDERLRISVVTFHDDQRHYLRPMGELAYRPQSGLNSSGQDSVWQLQASHEVVEKNIAFRAYDPRNASAWLDGEVDQSRRACTTYGEAYHYAEPYTELGDRFDEAEDLQTESGFFYARLRHERYLNGQTLLSGISSSASLEVGQTLEISGGAPQAFTPGVVITRLTLIAGRDRSLETRFDGIPYAENVCFRPPVPAKPQMAGTVPARVTSSLANDPYSHIDREGRYKVSFLFDRDSWKTGEESMWLRLARPYAGDTHGLHLPLICGTEVAIAFEQGDPDRPYIAHALHDSRHPDHVTLARRDYKRNVLRTPANNKLRMEDERGQEHIKLSTDHSGKSQLNLGHLVNAKKHKRGEGFELRTDGWGAIRAGNGLFISTDQQTKAQGQQLDMAQAIDQLQSALSLARSMAQAASNAEANPGDTDSQKLLNEALTDLKQPGLLLHAPAGIGLVSPQAICVSSGGESVGIMSARNTDISATGDITASAEGAISLCAQTEGMQIKAAQGDIALHAQRGTLHALAQTDIKIESVGGRVEISAPQELLINCGGAYIRIKDGEIEIGAPGNIYVKAAHVQKLGAASLDLPPSPIPAGYSAGYTVTDQNGIAPPFVRYQITTEQGEVFNGVTDKDGKTLPVHTALPGELQVSFPQAVQYDEQLQLVGPGGEVIANVRYVIRLADDAEYRGETDEQGRTERLTTRQPFQITRITLLPPDGFPPLCCAGSNVHACQEMDLSPKALYTHEKDVGTSLQTVTLPKATKRPLSAGEIAMAKTVFKDAIDYRKVSVHFGAWWSFMDVQSGKDNQDSAIYFPEDASLYQPDFSRIGGGRSRALFMHEMAHVWQRQLGYPVDRAELDVSRRGAATRGYTLAWLGKLCNYDTEQQAEMLSDYYAMCVEHDAKNAWSSGSYGKDVQSLKAVLADFLRDPSARQNLYK